MPAVEVTGEAKKRTFTYDFLYSQQLKQVGPNGYYVQLIAGWIPPVPVKIDRITLMPKQGVIQGRAYLTANIWKNAIVPFPFGSPMFQVGCVPVTAFGSETVPAIPEDNYFTPTDKIIIEFLWAGLVDGFWVIGIEMSET